MIVSIIAAMDRNRLIGNNNQLPWHLPADLAHFKQVTMGKPVIMGRKTYDFIIEYGKWPYGDKPTWVCSSNRVSPIPGCNLQMGSTPEDVIKEANAMGVKHLWLVGGGKLAASFIKQNRLTHISLSLMPVILGDGIQLFDSLPAPVNIQQSAVQAKGSGFVQLDYFIKIP